MCNNNNHTLGTKYYEIQITGGQPIGRGEYAMKRQVKNWYRDCQYCGYYRFLYSELMSQWKPGPRQQR